MQTEDIAAGLALCRAAGWNQTAREWALLLALSPSGCFVASKEQQVVGTVTTVRYEQRFAWIGMVLVAPNERGQGIAAALMNEALTSLRELPSVKLDATPAGHPVYRKLNFADEYVLSRLATVVSDEQVNRMSAPPDAPVEALAELAPRCQVRRMQAEDLPAVAQWDQEVFGADRRALLTWLLAGAPESSWIAATDGQLVGYLFGRPGFLFAYLGPLVARDEVTARRLISAALRKHIGKRLVLDVPTFATRWHAWLMAHDFIEQRQLTRMYWRGNPYPGLPHRQFTILGPEFG